MRTIVLSLGLGLGGVLVAQAPLVLLGDATQTAGQLIAGDFDGDGDVDFVSGASFLLNDGHANFSLAPGSLPPNGNSTLNGALAADFNGDGQADLFDASLGAFGVRLSLGGGAFGPPIPLPALPAPPGAATAAQPTSADAGDVDGDGDLDLLLGTIVYTNPIFGSSSDAFGLLLLNNGAGVFTVAGAGQFATSVAPSGRCFLRDIDGDGDLDGVFVEPTSLTPPMVLTRLNFGTGVFGAATQPPASPSTLLYAVCADFDGDGDADLVGSDYTPTTVLLPGGPAGFGAPVVVGSGFVPLGALDVTSDGTSELVVIENGGVVASRAYVAGVFGPPTVVAGPFAYGSDPAVGFGLRTGTPFGADLDGDGDRDLVLRNRRGPVRLINDGAGALHPQYGRSGPLDALEPIYGDFDGDGDLDVAAISGSPFGFVVSLNNGDGRFVAGPTTPVAVVGGNASYFKFIAFDRDGDGDDDLYCARNQFAPSSPPSLVGTDVVLDNVGSGAFVVAATPPTTQPVYKGEAFDADGDGDEDIVLARRTPTTISNGIGPLPLYIQNLGPAGMAAPIPFGVAQMSLDIAIADFDADGDLDILQVSGTVGQPPPGFVAQSYVYLNAGGTFVPVAQPGVVGGFGAAGDLDGDGDADAVINGQTYLVAAGTLTPAAPLASAIGNRAQLADLDLDGDLDLVESPCTIMMNAGGGAFGAPISILPRQNLAATSWNLPEARAADLDLDGDPDILTPQLNVISNVMRHLTTVGQPRVGRPERVDVYGAPGGAWFLFASTAQANLGVPGYGTLLIDPIAALPVGSGTFPPAPVPFGAPFGLNFLVPPVPALAGLSIYWQGVDVGTLRFTNRLTTTIAGY